MRDRSAEAVAETDVAGCFQRSDAIKAALPPAVAATHLDALHRHYGPMSPVTRTALAAFESAEMVLSAEAEYWRYRAALVNAIGRSREHASRGTVAAADRRRAVERQRVEDGLEAMINALLDAG